MSYGDCARRMSSGVPDGVPTASHGLYISGRLLYGAQYSDGGLDVSVFHWLSRLLLATGLRFSSS